MDPVEPVVIGTVARPHGIRGELAVEILTDFPDRFRDGLSVLLRGPGGDLRPARIATVRPHGGRVLVRFDGIETPEAAGELRGYDLCVGPGDVADRPEGFVFHYEVEGCEAVDREGRRLGTARDLSDAGGRSLLVLDTPRGARDVPFSWPIVVSVDLESKRIVLDPPAGLLD